MGEFAAEAFAIGTPEVFREEAADLGEDEEEDDGPGALDDEFLEVVEGLGDLWGAAFGGGFVGGAIHRWCVMVGEGSRGGRGVRV